ncbi:MAG TPA: CGNR zinc finger domain-containing protein [Marmoricola sp.]|nr:CGNR zinc finger domain-containing protein [Marmoricola sp.]HNO40234.1 CGNR zinc finger domain-containing protein [Marmoricola sp.]
MVFTHDVEIALQAAVFLANTLQDDEALTTVAALDEYFHQFQYTGSHQRTRAELEQVRALRPEIRELLLATREAAAGMVNDMLARNSALPQLVRHDELDWHLHAIEDDQPLACRIAVETAMAMVDVIRADEHSRISHCADESCQRVVLDLSRNRSKIYCSTTCGNRAAAAAYRARQAESPTK